MRIGFVFWAVLENSVLMPVGFAESEAFVALTGCPPEELEISELIAFVTLLFLAGFVHKWNNNRRRGQC